MDAKYRYGHRPGRRRRTRVLIVAVISLLIIGAIGGIIGYDSFKHRNSKVIEGVSKSILQANDSVDKLAVDEPTFNMELPGDWKEISRINDKNEHSITWQPTKLQESNRMIKLYIDLIPVSKSFNKLLPVIANGNKLNVGDISDNCALFTQGGTLNTGLSVQSKDSPAKYKGVDFICDLPRVTDNEIGTGSTEGINTFTLRGMMGDHKYFVLYTDHNNQPNYTVLYNAVRSLTAK